MLRIKYFSGSGSAQNSDLICNCSPATGNTSAPSEELKLLTSTLLHLQTFLFKPFKYEFVFLQNIK